MKAFERMNIQLHDHLSHQAYKHISIQVCAHVCGYHTSVYQRSMLTQEHPIIKVSMHISMMVYRKVDRFLLKHVDVGAYDYQSM